MRWRVIVGVLIGSLGVSEAWGQAREVCLDDQAGLNAPTMGSFYQEFQYLVGSHGVRIEGETCRPDAIRISFQHSDPRQPNDVLGAVHVVGPRVAPKLEVYVDRIIGLMPEIRCWNVVGRALARVAAHEVAHFIEQDQGHARPGLLQSHFSGVQLAGEDSYPFRWISSAGRRSVGE